MTWSTILSLIQLIIAFASWMQSRGWIQQGRDEERLATLEQINRSLKIAMNVEQEVDKKSDEEVDDLIARQGWYRQ